MPIYAWACTRFGLAGAAIIGLLEFYDRAKEVAGQPLASRARIIADLQGIVGKHVIDAALRDLKQAGAIQRHVKTEPGNNNLKNTVTYGLDLPGLSCILGIPDSGNSRNSRNRESPKLPEPGPESGVPTNNELEEAAAALRAHARGPAGATAPASARQDKRRRPRPSGIVTWYDNEIPDAEAIEQQYTPDDIAAAVAALRTINKEPVPGSIQQRIEQQQRECDAAARRAQEEATLQQKVHSQLDPAAQAKGEQLLPPHLRQRATKNHPKRMPDD